ncbi:hypothetical protein A2Z33_00340 [Candidatus Gottesmanbacteria bacterium RBG_16_52_11]|uniref:Phosphatidic acid phosphatase type 2/haloperoxidase domain-containing protein n=1 Tax=Candidatus Gottesmanbacteria bacterium RBG_16_52_11 TaxID=1798374 RepID=A0A1F5YMP7_9BACT|nr:MAG: hypothetical protein A2Z33_00340 [Candidatus Gottesmanbacteria bacterium RBG_16_52_11]
MFGFSVFLPLALGRSGLPTVSAAGIFVSLLLGLIVPVTLIRIWLIRTGRVSDWDIRKREQRLLPMALLIPLILAATLFIRAQGSWALTELFTVFTIWLIGFVMITGFWKISGHTAGISLIATILVKWYGTSVLLPAFAAVFLVAWSRVVRRDHTVAQVIAGASYSAILAGILPTG